MMIIMMIMVQPHSDWRKGMLAFSSLSPSETMCTVAWRGRWEACSEGGQKKKEEKQCRKIKFPPKVTPSHLFSICEFRHRLTSHITLVVNMHFWALYCTYCNFIVHSHFFVVSQANKSITRALPAVVVLLWFVCGAVKG